MLNSSRVLITGGAGFIGSNLAARLMREGRDVIVYDNLSRRGSERNLQWLKKEFSKHLIVIQGDVRDFGSVVEAMSGISEVFHFAAQVAVTTSVTDPRLDFEVNALGTFNIIEAARQCQPSPIVVYTSTNKVYGKMSDLKTTDSGLRHLYADQVLGISETRRLEFHSPYGCSKGTGDQYVIDYAKTYGIRTICFRMSCIYGERQFGNEDQGWVAHFARSALTNQAITIYGDGKQARDVLYIDDLLDAFENAIKGISLTSGKVYNIGGGSGNVISLLELVAMLEALVGHVIPFSFSQWRPGDQKVYVSDIRQAAQDFGWRPHICVSDGVQRLVAWLKEDMIK